ncbi:MAG TPA: helix-turn-helix transcriptional regulator [Pseudonocardia sp.]|jgi:poly-beta-hydroxybutyrate-responsive repressor
MGECEPRNFLQPCLLLLLRERSDHGYDLLARLRELHVAEGDAGAVYRALRGLERHGLVRSSWQTSAAGPARRTYSLTQAGLDDLDRQAVLLEATHETLHVFRGRYRGLAGARGHPMAAASPVPNGVVAVNGHHHPASPGEGQDHVEGSTAHRNGAAEPDERGLRPPLGAVHRAGR